MFGYERAQATAALVAATLFIWFTSLHRDGEAILCLIGGEAQTYENVGFALIVLVFMPAIPFALRRNRSRGLARAQMQELINDELGLIAALVGTVFAVTDYLRLIRWQRS